MRTSKAKKTERQITKDIIEKVSNDSMVTTPIELTEKELKQPHLKVQDEIAKLPEFQQKVIKDQQRLVNIAIDEMNDIHFSDTRFELDRFLSTNDIFGSDRDAFVGKLKRIWEKLLHLTLVVVINHFIDHLIINLCQQITISIL